MMTDAEPLRTDDDGGRRAEREAAVRMIRQMVAFWGITAEELDGPMPALEPAAPRGPKYRHPVTGDTWDGSGSHPDWLRKALLNDGYTVAELRVAPEGADT